MSNTPAQRRSLDVPVRVFRLGEEPAEAPLSPDEIGECFERVLQLSRRAFEISGQPAPAYTRATIPVRVVPLR